MIWGKKRPIKSHKKSYEGSPIKSHRANNSDTGVIQRIKENIKSISQGSNK